MSTYSRLPAILVAVTLAVAGCSIMAPPPQSPARESATTAAGPPPLSDEQTLDQMRQAARQIAAIAQLDNPRGNTSFASCNDQGDPPYKGVANLSFDPPAGVEREVYVASIKESMLAHGWDDGAPAGHHFRPWQDCDIPAMRASSTPSR